ncbi:MAG TPA: hypothetical protein VFE62_14095 [Gemmataceae bacterium]|nr:hypothetical protein [Gemmataceae bacterium]
MKIPLDQISVASPCHVSWDAMVGDDQARFCGQCSQHVYNLSEMTLQEAEDFVRQREGRTCIRFYKRADGTMMTKDCPVRWRAIKRRVAMVGAAAAAVLFAGMGIVTLGAFAASVRGNGNGGVQFINPITRLSDWLFPEHAAFSIPPAPPVMVMGEMCVPERQPPLVPEIAPPKLAVPAQEQK